MPGLRRLLRRPQLGDAGGGADQWAVAQPSAPRTAVPEGAALGEDDARVDAVQHLERKAKRGKGSRFEIGEHRIGFGDQAGEDPVTLRAAEVQPEAQVVAMRPGERLAHRVADAGLPQAVGIGGAFHLDDLGAEIAEEPAEFAAGDDDAQIDDPQSCERTTGTGGAPRRRRRRAGEPVRPVPPGRRRRRAEADVAPVDGEVAHRDGGAHTGRQFGLGDGATRPEMLRGQDLRGRQHRRDRHAVPLARRHQRRHGLSGEQLLDQHADPRPRREPRGDHVVCGVLEFVGLPQPGPQSVPLPRRHHTDPDVAVPTRVDRVGVLIFRTSPPPVGTPDPRRRLPVRAEGRVKRHHHRVEPGEVDVIACTAT